MILEEMGLLDPVEETDEYIKQNKKDPVSGRI
jgi:hypothetical protein